MRKWQSDGAVSGFENSSKERVFQDKPQFYRVFSFEALFPTLGEQGAILFYLRIRLKSCHRKTNNMKSALQVILIFSFLTLSACEWIQGQSHMLGNIPGLDASPVDVDDAISVGGDLAKAATLSDEEVIELAHAAVQELDSQHKIAPTDSSYDKRLRKIVSSFGSYDDLTLNYKVYITPEVNAFALADGSIRVYSGLMDLMSDSEVLSVIGHEIGHVKLGHRKQRMQRSYIASGATKAAGSAAGSAVGGATGVAAELGSEVVASIAGDILQAQFSQDDETESDEYGATMLRDTGRDPHASVSAIQKLAVDAEGEDSDFLTQFLSSHPQSKERLEHITLFVSNLSPPSRVETLEAKAIEASAEKQEKVEQAKLKKMEEAKSSTESITLQGSGVEVPAVTAQPEPAPKVEVTSPLPIPVEKEKEVEAPKVTERKIPAGDDHWYIQVGAYPDQAEATALFQAYSEKGETTFTREAMVDGIRYTRVLVGPYASLKAASDDLLRITGLGLSKDTPFYRKITD